jgi:hypothetical protein
MDLAEIERFGDGLVAADPAQRTPEELARWVIAFERLRNCVDTAGVAFLAEFHERGGWAGEGALSGAAWVASRTGSPRRDVRRRQQTGLGLRLLPEASRKAVTGQLSVEHLRALADCATRHPELAARDGSVLVEQAISLRAESSAPSPGTGAPRRTTRRGPIPLTRRLPETSAAAASSSHARWTASVT